MNPLKRKDAPESEDAGTQSKQNMTLKRLWETGECSDIKVEASCQFRGAKHFNVNKEILCTASKFFRSACSGSQRITVSEDPATTTLVLMSCYDYDFTFMDLLERFDDDVWYRESNLIDEYDDSLYSYRPLACHLLSKARVAAEKYGLPNLATKADRMFADHLHDIDLDILVWLASMLIDANDPSIESMLQLAISHLSKHIKDVIEGDEWETLLQMDGLMMRVLLHQKEIIDRHTQP